MPRLWIVPLLAVALLSCEGAKQRSATTPAPPPPPEMAPESEPAAEAAPPPEAGPAVQPAVEELARQVEAEYETGRRNYAAGHLDAARESFDRAFDLLLQSGRDVRSEPRLESAFQRLVESVHQLELQALQEGDGFTLQRPQPAPIDEAAQITFPVDPHIREQAEAELATTVSDLPLVLNDEVAGFITYFSSRGRATLERGLVRSGRYRSMILRILREEGVPQDLIYMAQAESGFLPLAVSRAGARGMWQFMASTASLYDLRRNWWVDERQDPEQATRAAARHLRDLYQQFGDWYLAIAAYNTGAGNVQRAVQRTGYADFWELYRRGVLPLETRNYVPIIVAVTIMAKNPEQYGLVDLELEQADEVDRVVIDYPLDLRLAAQCADTTVERLQQLNPSLLRMTTPRQGEFELRLPAGSAERFHAAIAAIPRDMRVSWRYHQVAGGETLGALAARYRTTAAAIAEANGLAGDEIHAGARLVIPVTPAGAGEALGFARTPVRDQVRRGDTVLSVADDFGVPPDRLRRWNGLKGNNLAVGRRLVIYPPAAGGTAAPAAPRPRAEQRAAAEAARQAGHIVHTVQPGDTLYAIAQAYNTTVAALLRDNRGLTSLLRPGDIVIITGRR
jgi:membrane-bound lytic murein transglycosylase D